MVASRFQYSPIRGPRNFRVVELLHADKTYFPWPSTTVHVQITQVNADSPTPYDALSYAWNVSSDQKPNRTVIVHDGHDQGELLIHQPLHEALVHLLDQELVRLPIFVDQICINQNDPQERALQVRLMREVYTKCLKTVVWLGPATKQTDRFLDFVVDVCSTGALNRLLTKQGPFVGAVFDAVQYPNSPCEGIIREERDHLLALVTQHGPRFPRAGVLDLFRRKWWERLWIIQEACLASEVLFVCGHRSLCFNCMRAGFFFFTLYNNWWLHNVHTSTSRSEFRQRDEVLETMKALIKLFQERKAIHTLGKKRTMYELILKYNVEDHRKKVGATYPEDRFFGLLGMAADGDAWSGIPHHHDYVQVYTDVAAVMAQQNLDFLLFVQPGERAASLPSWVPDWSAKLTTPKGFRDLTPMFSASGDKSGAAPDVANRVLSVDSYLVGRITEIGQHTAQTRITTLVQAMLEYASAKQLFDDLHRLLAKSSAIPGSPLAGATTREAQIQTVTSLADFGLTLAELLEEREEAECQSLLVSFYEQICILGERLLNSQRLVESYRVSSLVSTLGALPWYWLPPGEVQVLRSCAMRPRVTWWAGLRAGFQFGVDVLGVLLASTVVRSWPVLLAFRRRWQKVTPTDPGREQALTNAGMNGALIRSPEMNLYTDNFAKCAGSKPYMLDNGRIGLGPADMRLGDVVVVLEGSTTPHVLRQMKDPQSRVVQDSYRYVGEASCYGVMNGEIKEGGAIARRISLH